MRNTELSLTHTVLQEATSFKLPQASIQDMEPPRYEEAIDIENPAIQQKSGPSPASQPPTYTGLYYKTETRI